MGAMPADFIHLKEPGTGTPLLLLHGTGADETQLVGLGRLLLPGAPLLSPRGKVLENGMPRYFRRLAEGVFDEEDLRARALELAGWVDANADDPPIAVGFSNGANIAGAMLLLSPHTLNGALLIRPMVPLEPDPLPEPARQARPAALRPGRPDGRRRAAGEAGGAPQTGGRGRRALLAERGPRARRGRCCGGQGLAGTALRAQGVD